ncbi:hypothetical protein J3F83DRAFT_564478 [Trichoderma novae-zelandiae]
MDGWTKERLNFGNDRLCLLLLKSLNERGIDTRYYQTRTQKHVATEQKNRLLAACPEYQVRSTCTRATASIPGQSLQASAWTCHCRRSGLIASPGRWTPVGKACRCRLCWYRNLRGPRYSYLHRTRACTCTLAIQPQGFANLQTSSLPLPLPLSLSLPIFASQPPPRRLIARPLRSTAWPDYNTTSKAAPVRIPDQQPPSPSPAPHCPARAKPPVTRHNTRLQGPSATSHARAVRSVNHLRERFGICISQLPRASNRKGTFGSLLVKDIFSSVSAPRLRCSWPIIPSSFFLGSVSLFLNLCLVLFGLVRTLLFSFNIPS